MKTSIIMGAAKPLDQQIAHYLELLSTEQKKAVLSLVKSVVEAGESWMDDKAYIKEMSKRSKDLETGKVKGLTIEDLAAKARQAHKLRKRNRRG